MKSLNIAIKAAIITIIVLTILALCGLVGWLIIKKLFDFFVFILCVALGVWEG